VSDNEELLPWWQPARLEVGQSWHYAVGPLSVYLQRREGEWLLACEQQEDLPEYYRVLSSEVAAIPDSLNTTRFVFQRSPAEFLLRPRLLDRPVVVKTNQPVSVPAGEKVTFYISSPVCVNVELTEPQVVLQESQTIRLSDTWFGPTTRVGELCYAAKTHARNNREDVPLRPHRAITPVTIQNSSETMLAIEKLSIPVPLLAVYGMAEGSLWTDPVSLEHTGASALANVKIEKNFPAGVTADNRLAAARAPVQKGALVRAFANIFAS
jgi:hypothetical protein